MGPCSPLPIALSRAPLPIPRESKSPIHHLRYRNKFRYTLNQNLCLNVCVVDCENGLFLFYIAGVNVEGHERVFGAVQGSGEKDSGASESRDRAMVSDARDVGTS